MICKEQAIKIIQTGTSDKLTFTSKKGKQFESRLKLEPNGNITFDFN